MVVGIEGQKFLPTGKASHNPGADDWRLAAETALHQELADRREPYTASRVIRGVAPGSQASSWRQELAR